MIKGTMKIEKYKSRKWMRRKCQKYCTPYAWPGVALLVCFLRAEEEEECLKHAASRSSPKKKKKSAPQKSERRIAGEKMVEINDRVELLLQVTLEYKALKDAC